MGSPRIETIIFDLDGTLRHNIPSSDDTQFQIALHLGAVDDPALQKLGTRWAHYYWAQSIELSEDIAQFGENNTDFWNHYGYRYLRSMYVPERSAAELASPLVARMEAEYDPVNHVYPCAFETLGRLKEAGFTLGLVSNRTNPCQEECQTLGLLNYLEFAYVAGEVDAWKPDPRIFERAIQISGSPPENMLYVGDNYYADILGAQNAGLHAALLDENSLFPEAECTVIGRLDELIDVFAA
jgi:FMN phosphatase YigB (HAD superfamily)